MPPSTGISQSKGYYIHEVQSEDTFFLKSAICSACWGDFTAKIPSPTSVLMIEFGIWPLMTDFPITQTHSFINSHCSLPTVPRSFLTH